MEAALSPINNVSASATEVFASNPDIAVEFNDIVPSLAISTSPVGLTEVGTFDPFPTRIFPSVKLANLLKAIRAPDAILASTTAFSANSSAPTASSANLAFVIVLSAGTPIALVNPV